MPELKTNLRRDCFEEAQCLHSRDELFSPAVVEPELPHETDGEAHLEVIEAACDVERAWEEDEATPVRTKKVAQLARFLSHMALRRRGGLLLL